MNMWQEYDQYDEIVSEAWNLEVDNQGNPVIFLYKILANIKMALKNLNRAHFWNISGQVKLTETELTELIAMLHEDPFNEELIHKEKATKEKLLQLLK